MPQIKENFDYANRLFGDFKMTGDTDADMMGRSLKDQVFLAARSHLCPIPELVVVSYSEKFASEHPEITDLKSITSGGIEKAIKRYSECNFAMKSILITAQENNPELYVNLVTPINRLPNEEADKNLNPKYLPPDFYEKMNLASTPMGYAIPRLFILQRGNDFDQTNQENNLNRFYKGLLLVDKLVKKYHDPVLFTVKLADGVSQLDANPKKVLYHLLSFDLLKEEGCKTLYRQIFDTIQKKSPILKETYEEMLKQEGEVGLHEMGIIAPSDLI